MGVSNAEKVLITQEKIVPNIIQVYEMTKTNSKYSFTSEVKSCPINIYGITKTTTIKITNKPDIYNNYIRILYPQDLLF